MKTILLLGAGKSATALIDYLIDTARENKWKLIIADANKEQILAKTNNSPFAEAVSLDITNEQERSALIERAHLVISMMPPSLHFLVAKDCVEYRKHLLTASYLDNKIKSLEQEIKQKKLLFLCEMGLDPGIDHMSAMKIIEEIKAAGGKLRSFKSHCGGLVAPESDDNPWHYKISWNPRNVVLAGKAGAEYKLDDKVIHKGYEELFAECEEVNVDGLGKLAFYPNRDSLSYLPVYHLEDAGTFVRTTLRYADYCKGWKAIVNANLANETDVLKTKELSFKTWSSPIIPFVNDENRSLLEFLGLFDDAPVPSNAKHSADVLQYLLETKLMMQPADKDMIVMLHEIEYETADGKKKKIESSLVVKGEDSLRTAMAKTVGLPLGIAAKLILNEDLRMTGVHIPIQKEIYEPVLKELENFGVVFKETEK
ncbi:MAG: saccharopine dehydrogenase NADP-binding domain-containing protein [Chitinophagaceae bacterium]|nr:saccharopine dehydrogenase NADP-binding domain-containing protein [Chitinophagaceae bacterium]